MSECITTSPYPLDVATLEVGTGFVYTVRVNAAMPKIRIHFNPPRTQNSVGSVDGVLVTPSGPDHGTDWVEFTTSHLDITYTVQVSYSEPPRSEKYTTPLETPTKSPQFKPKTTCPTGEG